MLKQIAQALLLACLLISSASAPAVSFELFGVKLFGDDEEADAEIVDPVAYTAELRVDPDVPELSDKLVEGSLLIRKQEQPPSGTIGLISRARDDEANLLALLFEEAFYGGTVSTLIGGRRPDQIDVTDRLTKVDGKVPVSVIVSTGPAFRFGDIRLVGGDRALARRAAEDSGLLAGNKASSRTIVEAERAIVEAWQREGHPFAKVSGRQVVADHATQRLDVALRVEPGPAARLGPAEVSGAERISPEFLVRQANVPAGEEYHPKTVERIRKNLTSLDALGSVSVKVRETPDANGLYPVIIEVSERKRRTVGAGAFYSSVEGLALQTFWLHRNLFGEAESIRVDASVGQLFEADELDEYDGLFSVLYSVPGFLHPSNRLDVKVTALQEDPDPYNRRGVVVSSQITHKVDDYLSISGGVTYDWARIDDAFGRNSYTLFSLPAILTYDTRSNVLDPTSGVYAQVKAEPLFEVSSTAGFFVADAELRHYLALDDNGRYVLAARGLVGTIAGARIADIPAHRRFYAGGGGSVRGYDHLNIGPRVAGFGATGGLSRVEGSFEARIKLTETIGVVPFIDAGLVTARTLFAGNDDFQVGVGLGLRYYTAVGPIRLDVAVPLDPRSSDPDFAIYAGIGQTF